MAIVVTWVASPKGVHLLFDGANLRRDQELFLRPGLFRSCLTWESPSFRAGPRAHGPILMRISNVQSQSDGDTHHTVSVSLPYGRLHYIEPTDNPESDFNVPCMLHHTLPQPDRQPSSCLVPCHNQQATQQGAAHASHISPRHYVFPHRYPPFPATMAFWHSSFVSSQEKREALSLQAHR